MGMLPGIQPVRKWWVISGLLAAGAWWFIADHTPAVAQVATGQASPPPAPVRVAAVMRQDIPLMVQAVGQLQPLQQVDIRPQIEGVLNQVLFQEGQQVQRGQVLAKLDDRSLRAQEAQAQAELARLQAQLNMARLDLQRYEGLAAQSAISLQQRDQQVALVAQLQAQVQAQQASLQSTRVQLSHATITSPIAGKAGLRKVDAGNVVRPSDASGLVTVVQTHPMAVVFAVPQSRLQAVSYAVAESGGASVVLTSQELQGRELARGRVTTIDNLIDPATGSLKLKAQVPNSAGRLWPGQFVTVQMQTGQLKQALVVPMAALQKGLKGDMVWRVQQTAEGMQAHAVPVTVSWQDDTRAVIASGLSEGDQVVIDGHARLKPKAKVKVAGDKAPPTKAKGA
jgi:membrane fusion protein, multidrug efflux system